MREILFRGKRKNNGEWVKGMLLATDVIIPCGQDFFIEANSIIDAVFTGYEVIRETAGQHTGLTDKNGKKIFEGDVVDVAYKVDYVGTSKHRVGLFKVVFHNGCFMKKAISDPQLSFNDNAEKSGLYHFIPSDETEVVGNVFDNAEYGGGTE